MQAQVRVRCQHLVVVALAQEEAAESPCSRVAHLEAMAQAIRKRWEVSACALGRVEDLGAYALAWEEAQSRRVGAVACA
jgi:hypothetical protein